MNRTLSTLAVLALGVALAVAGCGGGSSNSGGAYGGGGSSTEQTSSTPAGEGGASVVSVASVPKLGKVIVDSKGFTLYDFHKDKGTKSACYGACAKVWPPLTTTAAPKAGEGAQASQLGTAKRSDGTVQVTYAGHPLYTYTADSKPGEVNGNDFSSYGAQWYALKPSGEEASD